MGLPPRLPRFRELVHRRLRTGQRRHDQSPPDLPLRRFLRLRNPLLRRLPPAAAARPGPLAPFGRVLAVEEDREEEIARVEAVADDVHQRRSGELPANGSGGDRDTDRGRRDAGRAAAQAGAAEERGGPGGSGSGVPADAGHLGAAARSGGHRRAGIGSLRFVWTGG